MKKETKLIAFLFMLTFITGSCQSQCDLIGDWVLTGTQTPQGRPYNHDRVSFSEDSINLMSGFYYAVIDQNNFDKWRSGRYPFMYYGSKEKYKIVGDSLYLYSTPYKEWEAFKIICNESGKIRLVGKRKEWRLLREEATNLKRKCAIRYINAHVFEFEDVGNYAINYKVTYSNDDKLTYQQLSNQDPDHAIKTFQLSQGTFDEICQRFNYLDVTKILSSYEAGFSDPEIIELELGLGDGRTIKSRIESPEYPDELRLALIPILYGHQKLVHPHLRPID